MNWDLIFTITNNYALLMWLILAFAPRRTAIMTGIFYGGVGLLAGTYAVIVIPMMTGQIDGGSGGIPDFSTLAGVQQLLSSPGQIRVCALAPSPYPVLRADARAVGAGSLPAFTFHPA